MTQISKISYVPVPEYLMRNVRYRKNQTLSNFYKKCVCKTGIFFSFGKKYYFCEMLILDKSVSGTARNKAEIQITNNLPKT
jgi:hypothetical protein